MVLRALALTAGLTLALPAGWCCYVQLWLTERTQPAPTHPPADRPGCCCQREASAPPPAETPRPRPAPEKCCCADRQTTLPDQQHADGPDLAVWSPLPTADVTSKPGPGAVADAAEPPRLPAPHILHCVWLC
jgi:hypothetical protein